MQKKQQFRIKGMQRDLSVAAFNPEYAYENKNIRIMPLDESTLLSIVNEKGNLLKSVNGLDDGYLQGIPIGQQLINNQLVIFTTKLVDNVNTDYIYKLWLQENEVHGLILFTGDLNFSTDHPIEAISFYENENIQKVYWVDGLNQLRFINIAAPDTIKDKWTNNSFDVVQKLNLKEVIDIQKLQTPGGNFPSGILQYHLTYFNKYGQESNIFYSSPLLYTSFSDRGGSPEESVGNAFQIQVDNLDSQFDYIRIYSTLRTSIDSTPTAKKVIDLPFPKQPYPHKVMSYITSDKADSILVGPNIITGDYEALSLYPPAYTQGDDSYYYYAGMYDEGFQFIFSNGDVIKPIDNIVIKIDNNGSTFQYANMDGDYIVTPLNEHIIYYSNTQPNLTFVDTGVGGELIDPTQLLYLGGEKVIFGTLAQKDNTLFLGNIKIDRPIINTVIKDFFKGKPITFDSKKLLESPSIGSYYQYSNQLNKTSQQIKTFKYLDWYRFGLQFQHSTGKWSEPIWVNDVKNNTPINNSYVNSTPIELPIPKLSITDSNILQQIVDLGYKKIRPVVVYPSIQDRECVCQGILCPTVYNLEDRYTNSPFAQASWFCRPNAQYDIQQMNTANSNYKWSNRDNNTLFPNLNSRGGVLFNKNVQVYNGTTYLSTVKGITNLGSWSEFRHNYPIPSNDKRNAEIQCIYDPPSVLISNTTSTSDLNTFVQSNIENYYVDQSIITIHSPEIEFDDTIKNIDKSNLKLRIVGIVPLTSSISNVDIQTSTTQLNYKNTTDQAFGFYKESIGSQNISRFGWKGLNSAAFWVDEVYGSKLNTASATGFMVYPWHRNGPLNNQKNSVNNTRSALLQYKKISNFKFSYSTKYLIDSKVWYAYTGTASNTGISGVSIFDSDEQSLLRLKAPNNSNLEDLNYYGNIDKLVIYPSLGAKVDGYPIVNSNSSLPSIVDLHHLFEGSNFKEKDPELFTFTYDITNDIKGKDPVRIKYKTTKHGVIVLNYTTSHEQRVLPTLTEGVYDNDVLSATWSINSVNQNFVDKFLFWDKTKTTTGISQDVLDIDFGRLSQFGYGPEYGYLWLGELYNDNVINRFGGQTDTAFENNKWLPCGDSVAILDDNDIVKTQVDILWLEGDTYYQRYDHIKAYPYTSTDQNSVLDTVSFMCETRINIDGRYDKNRGQITNLTLSPKNTNIINKIYSQENNYFIYRGLNIQDVNIDYFKNSISWTKTKTPSEIVDTWTNITLASILDLDGDKGDLKALRRFNNDIISFQDRGIANILFNSRTQLSSTDGVPIEIANSGKVEGKRYLSDKMGCVNKWSICETPAGLYFIDDITKGIFILSNTIEDISDKLGFHSWINSRSKSLKIWNPIDFENIVTYYDKTSGDVYFISKDECLAYSEPLGQFTSFYSYEGTPYMINLEDKTLQINKSFDDNIYKIWEHNAGDYNMYYGQYQPFYVTLISNPDISTDKIFNNIEFRSDSWDGENIVNSSTFDKLITWNEYQYGESTLADIIGKPSPLKRKFRVWRANIPRASENGRDRMRNPWLYIKLSKEEENTYKTLLHDVIVYYFE